MGDIFYVPKNTYTIEEEGFPTVTFENDDITIVSPDGVKVIIEENQVHVKFEIFAESAENESLSALFTPGMCQVERNSSREEEKVASAFYYPDIKLIDEATCFHYKQEQLEITVNNKGHYHGAVTVGTNTEEKYFLPPKKPISKNLKKRLTFLDMQDTTVIELSEKNFEEDENLTDEDEFVIPDSIFEPESYKHKDSNIERRVFLLPPSCGLESNFKYGFELFEEDLVSKNFKNPTDMEKIGENFVAMKPIVKTATFAVPSESVVGDFLPKIDCTQFDVVKKLKAEWKDSCWTQKFVVFLF